MLAVAMMALTKTSAANSAFPPLPNKTIRPVSHAFDLQIRSLSNDGQGEGNHRRHRVRTNHDPPRHTLTAFLSSRGATCSGKTTLAKYLRKLLPGSTIIHQDVRTKSHLHSNLRTL